MSSSGNVGGTCLSSCCCIHYRLVWLMSHVLCVRCRQRVIHITWRSASPLLRIWIAWREYRVDLQRLKMWQQELTRISVLCFTVDYLCCTVYTHLQTWNDEMMQSLWEHGVVVQLLCVYTPHGPEAPTFAPFPPCPFTSSSFLFLICFTYFLLLSIPSLYSTRVIPLRFQARGRRRQPNLGLVCCLFCVICIP